MEKLRLSAQVEKKLNKGIVLLEKDDLSTAKTKDNLVQLVSKSGQLIATAYLSEQNKGLGWVISKDEVELTQAFFENLFIKAKKSRLSYINDSNTTAYRLFNQEGDGFGGFTVDRYDDFAVFSWYNAFVYRIKDMVVEAFKTVFPELVGAYEKYRFKGAEIQSAHLYGEEAPEAFDILENNIKYQIFLNDGLMTGIFLDQHDVRGRLIDGLAAGKSVLNLFSYTAAFSIAAAMGGATQTTSVDLAKRSVELSEAHFKANGLDMANHKLMVMDVFDYYRYAKRHELTYDVIVIDPPSFARNKKQTFSVSKDYHRLVNQALDLLNPNGLLILSTNASNLSVEQFQKQINKGFGEQAYQVLSLDRLPDDFKINKNDERSNYLKVFTIKVE
ncbi:class I SAM-dependent rRNA methyltransferase [Streptococcus jiangjianxini]|uniref:class I SAM-dependent rRNA methyltransferase n=1 Tax=Streptococcus jiangjianxini TaxID=3161189 RepID=UPI0032ECCF39